MSSRVEGFASIPIWMMREKDVSRRAVLVYASLSSRAGLGAIYSIWTFYGAGWSVTFWGLVLLAVGAPVYWLMRRTAR